ncbi:MAG: hypothetical protein HGA96_02275 [Desulfobulbaceae bacterium]|nr:hypothetical protein [Desulfobulbaceae bacterium]
MPQSLEITDNNSDENCNGMTDDLYLAGPNDPATTGYCSGHDTYITSGMCTPQAMGQEFVASQDNLAAVELFMKNLKGVPADIAINIRESTLAGQIIGSSTYLSAPISAAKNWQGWALFAFAAPVELIPGNVYVIELIHAMPAATAWYWLTNSAYDQPVSGAIICNNVRTAASFYFRTYTPATIDQDMDGFSPPEDCNDASDDITYGNAYEASQACVAIGHTGACAPFCTDNDQDGFPLGGGKCEAIDCDDRNAAVNLNAAENINNKIDENCYGMGDDLQVLPIITKAEYSKKERKLIVNATSWLGRNDSLVVTGLEPWNGIAGSPADH